MSRITTGEPEGEYGGNVVPYRLKWRPRGVRPGAHPGQGDGGDGTFRTLVPLVARPDPRRIDLRASLRDPFEGVHVRTFAPRRATTVAVLTDLSGSMGFDGTGAEVARLAATLAASAAATGDEFTLIGAGGDLREGAFIPATRRRGLGAQVAAAISDATPSGTSTRGLATVAERLPRRRCLVFLVSDFLMPEADLDLTLDALWRHDVVPVLVRDSRTEGDVPAWGLMEVADAETGGRRLVFMRPGLRARWQATARARIAALEARFVTRGYAPFHLVNRFDADALVAFLASR
ncbi:DUF58 domain-containing protein [Xanthobacter sp. 126]|uniref:DUF58 domain-containing protein n=1 Tax=Xanthobacter sp. 126 TaxID=1131814 RepID=UPI0004B51D39|nr:DUF58 domain-containing protein [Xanthobacter sp. 126]